MEIIRTEVAAASAPSRLDWDENSAVAIIRVRTASDGFCRRESSIKIPGKPASGSGNFIPDTAVYVARLTC